MFKNLDILIILLIVVIFPLVYYGDITPLRILLIYPLTFFIPGYLIVINLFPREPELTTLERVIFSLGLSIAVVPLVIFVLNYTPCQITEESMLWTLTLMDFILSITASIRRRGVSNPYYPKITFKTSKSHIIAYLLMGGIIFNLFYSFYMALVPYNREPFTEFYVLDENGNVIDYTIDILPDENKTFTVGIINHEKRNMTYYIKILGAKINYKPKPYENRKITNDYGDMDSNVNSTLISTPYGRNISIEHIIDCGEFNVSLEPLPNDTIYTMEWIKQYETNYSVNINETGKWEVWFILYKDRAPPNNNTQCIIDAINGSAIYLKVFVRVINIEFSVSDSDSKTKNPPNQTKSNISFIYNYIS